MLEVVVTVTDVDEPGTVTLSTLQPVDGVGITAVLADIDRGPGDTTPPSEVVWKWTKSNSSSSCNVTDVEVSMDNGNIYTPRGDAVGMYVCVVVTYEDAEGDAKTVQAVSAARVLATRSTNVKPEFKNAEGEAIDQCHTGSAGEHGCASTRGRADCGSGSRGRHIDVHAGHR